MIRTLAKILLAACILCSASARAETLPWDSWEMAWLDHWMQSEGNGNWVSQIQPITTDYALTLIDGLDPKDPAAKAQLDALAAEIERTTFESDRFHIAAKLLAGYAYARSPAVKMLELPAYENPLLERNEGEFIDGGNMGTLGVRLSGGLTDYFSFDATPILRLASRDTPLSDHASLYLKEAVGTVRLGSLAIEGGKGSVIWGSGRYSHLLFSGDNEAFLLGRLRAIEPVILPSFLKYLGPARFDAFFGVLDKNREFPHARLIGADFTFQPHPRFEFGVGQTVLFGGSGSPTGNPLVYFSEQVVDGPNPANRNLLLSGRWRIPALEIEAYGEVMIEDCCRAFALNPRDSMYLAGIYFPQVDPGGKADLAVEWARTNEIAYRHSTFSSGYTYKGRMLGHPLGPDAVGIYAIFRYFVSEGILGKAVFSFEERGTGGRSLGNLDIVIVEPGFQKAEQRYRAEFSARLRPKGPWAFDPRLGFERVNNFAYQRDRGRWMFLVGFDLEYRI
jgi:hypothetical protein